MSFIAARRSCAIRVLVALLSPLVALLVPSTATAQVASALIREGDALAGGVVNSVNNPAVNHIGGFSLQVNSSDGLSHIWGNATGGPGAIIISEGTYGDYEQTAYESFNGLSDDGLVAYSPTVTEISSGLPGLDAAWVNDQSVLVEREPVLSMPGQFSVFNSRPGITGKGDIYWVGGISTTQGGSTQNRVLFYGNDAEPKLQGGDLIGGIALTHVTSNMDFDNRFSRLGTHYIIEALVTSGSTTNDAVMAVDGNAVLAGGALMREGSPVPPAVGGIPGENWAAFDMQGITEFGQIFVTGDTSAAVAVDEFVYSGGTIVLREGTVLAGPAGNYTVSGAIESGYQNRQGDWAVTWDANNPSAVNVEVLIVNGQIVLTEGDLVDLDGDGTVEPNSKLADFTGISSLALGPRDALGNVTAYFTADVDTLGTPSSTDDTEALLRLTVPLGGLNGPPAAICRNVVVAAAANCVAQANINDGSSDPNDDPMTLEQDPPGPYPPGDTEVTLTVTDIHGSADSCVGTVTVTAACDDGDPCTDDLCLATYGCVHSPTCDDGNPCTNDECDKGSGQCVCAPNDANLCDDGNACTTDICSNGHCVSTTAVACNDGNACTSDTCDPRTGSCVSESIGLLQTVTIEPAADTTIYASDVDRSNGAGLDLASGGMGPGSARRTLLRFDVASALPAGAQVRTAALALHCETSPSDDERSRRFRLVPVNASWGEAGSNPSGSGNTGAPAQPGDATWDDRFFEATPWAIPGGDYAVEPSAVSNMAGTGVTYFWGSTPSLVDDVSGWLTSPATNHGWILLGDEMANEEIRTVSARESATPALRPRLTISYVVPDVTGTGPGEVPDGMFVPGPQLKISKNGPLIHLEWGPSCACSNDYAVYEGAPGVAPVPRLCSTGGATSADLAPSPGLMTYLVAPLGEGKQGSFGRTSTGAQRPITGALCRPAADTSACTSSSAACYFDCSAWDPAHFGSAIGQAPGIVGAVLRSLPGSRVGVPGRLINGHCKPDDLLPGVASIDDPPGPPPVPSGNTDDVGAGDGSVDPTYALELAYRYACVTAGRIVGPSQAPVTPAPERWQDPASGRWFTHEGDIQSEAEAQCAAAGTCVISEGDNACPSNDLAALPDASYATLVGFDPNAHTPKDFIGRRVVAELLSGEETCKVFKAIDQAIARLGGTRWGVYASYGATGGAGGGARLASAFLYDMSEWESAAYVDVGVTIGIFASVNLNAARGLSIGKPNHSYNTIHNFFGGLSAGISWSISTPIAEASAGGALSVSLPAGHPVNLECSVGFGVGIPLAVVEGGVSAGCVIPEPLGTNTLRGITGGFVNVFGDVFGNVVWDGVGPNGDGGGNRSRMRNAPNETLLWKGGSVANSAARFARAPDIGAFVVLRATAEYEWSRMRTLCGF